MLIRALVLFLILCTGCKSGLIPCPEVKGLRLKKRHVNKRSLFDRAPREEAEPVVTVSSDARVPQQNKRRYRYVEYTIEHVDVNELDCPKPGEKKTMPKTVRNNIRKNRKKIRQHYEQSLMDEPGALPVTFPQSGSSN